MEYAIVEAATAAELQDRVTARMAAGWVPAGGVAVFRTDFGAGFYQAVVLLPDEPDDDE